MTRIYIAYEDDYDVKIVTLNYKKFREAVDSTFEKDWEVWENNVKIADSLDDSEGFWNEILN